MQYFSRDDISPVAQSRCSDIFVSCGLRTCVCIGTIITVACGYIVDMKGRSASGMRDIRCMKVDNARVRSLGIHYGFLRLCFIDN